LEDIAKLYLESIPSDDIFIDILNRNSNSSSNLSKGATAGTAGTVDDDPSTPSVQNKITKEVSKANECPTSASENSPDDEIAAMVIDNASSDIVELCGDEVMDESEINDEEDSVFEYTGKKHINGRKRKSRRYIKAASKTSNPGASLVSVSSSATIDCAAKIKNKPPTKSSFYAFMAKRNYTAFNKSVRKSFDMTKNSHYTLSFGALYCTCCNVAVDWNNRGKHLLSLKHEKNDELLAKLKEDLSEERKLVQSRISAESLVGSTYQEDRIDQTNLWLKIAIHLNASFRSIGNNKVIYSKNALLLQRAPSTNHHPNLCLYCSGTSWSANKCRSSRAPGIS